MCINKRANYEKNKLTFKPEKLRRGKKNTDESVNELFKEKEQQQKKNRLMNTFKIG